MLYTGPDSVGTYVRVSLINSVCTRTRIVLLCLQPSRDLTHDGNLFIVQSQGPTFKAWRWGAIVTKPQIVRSDPV